MKERPILFSAPMVLALLSGVKSQTRRLVKFPFHNNLGSWEPTTIGGAGVMDSSGDPAPEQVAMWHTHTGRVLVCPYGVPGGTRLWVRETFALDDASEAEFAYSADGATRRILDAPDAFLEAHSADSRREKHRWIPSIHMPRWASRLTLEVTGVKVERLNDISEEDAKAEGVRLGEDRSWAHLSVGLAHRPYRTAFEALWDRIHGAGSWAPNPWVFAISFRKVTP